MNLMKLNEYEPQYNAANVAMLQVKTKLKFATVVLIRSKFKKNLLRNGEITQSFQKRQKRNRTHCPNISKFSRFELGFVTLLV